MYRTGLISGDKMSFTFNKDNGYQLWLSTQPADNSGNVSQFMFIGSSASYPVQAVHSSSTTGILGQRPDKAIYVDGVNGIVIKVNISAIRPSIEGSVDTITPTSNQAFANKLEEIRSSVQMERNAYVLRVYNISTHNPNTQSASIQERIQFEQNNYRDLYVFLDSYDLTWDISRPNEMNVNMSFIMRNLLVGFDDS